MRVKDLANDDTVLMWFEIIDCEETTKAAYLQAMQDLTEMTGKTPEELKREAKIEKKTLDLEDRSINSIFIKFRSMLQDRGLASITVRTRLTGITSFYSAFKIDVPKLRQKGKKGKAKTLKENRKIPELEDLQKALKVTDILETAVLLTGVSSGLSCIDITKIKYQDYTRGYDSKTGLCLLDLERSKTGVEFKTILSKEATDAINLYLEWRDRKPNTGNIRRIRQISKQEVTKDSYLFIKRDVPEKYLETQNEQLRQLTRNSILKMYRSINERAGLSTEPGHWNVLRSHNLRKIFSTKLSEAGCNVNVIERMMGHDLGSSMEGYLEMTDESLKKVYEKYQPFLKIQSEVNVTETKDFKTAIEERDHYKALAQKYLIDNVDLLNAKSELAVLKYKSMSPEQQKEELIKSISEIKPVLSPNPNDKEKENAENMNRMRDMVLQILKDK